MPPAQPPVPSTFSAQNGVRLVRELLLDPRRFWQLAGLLLVGELALGLLIVRFVPCEWSQLPGPSLVELADPLCWSFVAHRRHRNRLPGVLAAGRRLPRR